MARARLLKPGFFTNSALGRLPMGARLVFQGLWCVADREGRLVDDPARLKVEILPYDRVNMDRLLDDLREAGFIVRYESGGRRFIQIVNFLKHQRPHAREVPSTIPGIAQAQPRHDPGTAEDTPGTPLTLNPIPLTPNQIQKPIPVAVADPGPPPEDPLPPLLRHWERSTGTTVTPALADWLDSELGQATPAEWLRDAIAETGANGSKAWKYTKAIIERWRLHGREPRGGTERRHRSANADTGRRPEEACRVTGQSHDWPNLPGWCERCTVQEPITEESLRRRGLLVE